MRQRKNVFDRRDSDFDEVEERVPLIQAGGQDHDSTETDFRQRSQDPDFTVHCCGCFGLLFQWIRRVSLFTGLLFLEIPRRRFVEKTKGSELLRQLSTVVSRFSGIGPSPPKCPLKRDSPLNGIIPI